MSSERDLQRAYGRIGGLTAWARNDPSTMVGPAHAGFRAKFERAVDPEGRLTPRERAVRADRARRAYMLTLAARSAASRKKKAGPVSETTGTGQEERRGPDHAGPSAA
ncbi:MAG: hypothetical protein U0838_01585 [Chloroflexota bacterium]